MTPIIPYHKSSSGNQDFSQIEWVTHSVSIQGPPYLLARYKMAILSKCAHDFQKNFSWKQGFGRRECSCLMFFQIGCCLQQHTSEKWSFIIGPKDMEDPADNLNQNKSMTNARRVAVSWFSEKHGQLCITNYAASYALLICQHAPSYALPICPLYFVVSADGQIFWLSKRKHTPSFRSPILIRHQYISTLFSPIEWLTRLLSTDKVNQNNYSTLFGRNGKVLAASFPGCTNVNKLRLFGSLENTLFAIKCCFSNLLLISFRSFTVW